jgi:hypothetical protein
MLKFSVLKNHSVVSERYRRLGAVFLMLLVTTFAHAQLVQRYPINLQWNGVTENQTPYDSLLCISLESGRYDCAMPVFVQSFPIFDDQVSVQVELLEVKTLPLSNEEHQIAKDYAYNADFELEARVLRSRDEALLNVRITPFRQSGDLYEKLLSATLSVSLTPDFSQFKTNPVYVDRSAMASGDWYKIGLSETGIYKLTYNDLNSLGINLSGLDPRTIRIYHNGGGVLPELNAEARHDDLVEIPIYVYGESDGRFDQNDYILFYGRGPLCWRYNATRGIYEHQPNPYDDYSYAFVVTGLGNGKRISEVVGASGAVHATVSEFIDYQVYEAKDYNLRNVGRTYYGDKMDGTTSKSYSFSFPNAITSRNLTLRAELAGRNYKPASFEVYVDGNKMATYSIATTTANAYAYAYNVGGWITSRQQGATVGVTLKHIAAPSSVSEGYVDYLALNVWRSLSFTGSQMLFRNPEAGDINKVYEYRLSGASQQLQVWNVTDPVAPSIVKGQLNNSVLAFKVNGNQDNEFVAFNGNAYCTAKTFGKIANQNLHGIRDVDFVILSYADFLPQAERLKTIHAQLDPDLNIFITTPELIYNEFSCGAKDISAIRDFCRMLYLDSSPGRNLKYLLLLGDCSYDYKNRTEIVDFVPAYETVASLHMGATYVTDDFFGCMDENEGNIDASLADIGIGRFPVSTLEQATQMVDKIERYIVKDSNTMQPWRNTITFFTDDEGGFVETAESVITRLRNMGGEAAVIDKIYLDAYQQQSSPGGEICPEVNAAINSRMERGTLVMNYVGHGGEVQLAEERILQRKDVDAWRNAPMYPLMITGTCEFSRYDDHTRTSLGEYSFLNPYGGMIAMFTTSRLTDGGANKQFILGIYNNLLGFSGGEHPRLGDVYRMAKTTGRMDEKRYVFFGDPVLRLAYPKWKVETVSISDTLSALRPVEIEGVVKDLSGNVASSFNGVVHVTVYDKAAELSTLGSTSVGAIPFALYNSIVFNGKTEVKNGRFTISFIVPRDISYRYGKGMVSYYATDYVTDANGRFEDFVIGGFYDDAFVDNNPPEINLFIDDTLFVSGGLTGESPTLLGFIEDESGINTTGAGIGHDIVATLSGPSDEAYCLNDYFVSEIDNPGKGHLSYRLQSLEDGDYTLTLKVWDIYNNSNTATIRFTVVHSDGMCIENPVNYPNPFCEETCFTFEHNQVGNNLQVQIDIFDIMGRWVHRINKTVGGSSTRVSPIRWNGRGAGGENLKNGVYIYRILTTNDAGETASVVSKLVLSK